MWNNTCLVHATKKSDEIVKAQNVFLQRVNEKRGYEDVVKLSDDIGPRVSTTDEEYQGAKYIQSQFDKLGFETEIQSFDVYGSSKSVLKDGDKTIESVPFTGAQPTSQPVTGELVYCGLGKVENFKDKNLEDKIALIERGVNNFTEKVRNAKNAGAKAVVVYNSSSTGIVKGQQYSEDCPAVGITRADGLALLERLNAGESVSLSVEVGEIPVNKSWNVVASMKPWNNGNKKDKKDSKDEAVLVTAHMDSVTLAPGANDNASGCAAMLEIARSMKGLDIDKEVRFIAFGSEEAGLLGSQAYVNSLSDS